MSQKLYAGVAVLAVLGGAIYMAKTKDDKIGTTAPTSAELPDLKAGDLDKLSIANGEKPEIVLEKKADKWVMTKPVEAAASQTNVDQVVKNLKELKATEVIVPTASEDSKKDYEFLPSKQVHVLGYKDGAKTVDMTFGSSGQRGQMAMVDGKPGIYAVSGYSSYLFTKEPKGFRDTEILKFDDQNVTNVTIEKKDGTLSFTKDGDKWAGTYKGRPIDRFDADKVKQAVGAFKNMVAEDFGDGKTLADTGLDQPESKVTIQLKDNAGKHVIKIGKSTTGNSRWALKEGSDNIYQVTSFIGDWANPEVSKFQKSADAGAEPAKAPHGLPPGMQMPSGMGDPHGH